MSNAYRVIDNFVWRVKAITSTESQISGSAWRDIDPLRVDPDTLPNARAFYVEWLGAGPENHEDISRNDRFADHEFELVTVYQVGVSGLKHQDAAKLILRDRDDLITELRDPAKCLGYSDAAAATNIGLIKRTVSGETLDRSSTSVWLLRQRWTCKINESEL
ncbi:MAG: hypothetical protein ACPGWS_07340 [Solirubrobacterales bacterium]